MSKKQTFSFEVFPPNTSVSTQKLYEALGEMKGLEPDYISVTCSNNPDNIKELTVRVSEYIKKELGLPCIAHLPAMYISKEQVLSVMDELKTMGIDGLLALRGDIYPDKTPVGDFRYASDLISFIREKDGEIPIFGACYPEVHPDSRNRVEDIQHLKKKVDAGCGELITQLFFDNEIFYHFQESCTLAGIDKPIVAGIMPIINRAQALRLIETTKAKLPRKFTAILDKYEHSKEALRDAGIAYAVDQIVDLVTNDVAGIHLYTMNNAQTARDVYRAVASLFGKKTAQDSGRV